MSNVIFNRSEKKRQDRIKFFKREKIDSEILFHDDGREFRAKINASEPIEPEELKKQLLKAIYPQPKITMSEELKQEDEIKIELVHFANLHEFASWYENNKDKFSEKQVLALNTLMEARQMTLGGCSCDREKRKLIAEEYFKKFWLSNHKTDLASTLLKALKSKKVILGNFFSFPS